MFSKSISKDNFTHKNLSKLKEGGNSKNNERVGSLPSMKSFTVYSINISAPIKLHHDAVQSLAAAGVIFAFLLDCFFMSKVVI